MRWDEKRRTKIKERKEEKVKNDKSRAARAYGYNYLWNDQPNKS